MGAEGHRGRRDGRYRGNLAGGVYAVATAIPLVVHGLRGTTA